MPAKKKEKEYPDPFSRPLIMSVLAFVLAAGGYGGYEVAKTYGKYGANFDKRPHVVEDVMDGDTLVVENGIRIRLLGVDAPEKGECFAGEARQGLSELILGRRIVLEKDQVATDNFDRLLRYAFLYEDDPDEDAIFLNRELIRRGLALSQYVKPNRHYLQQLQAAEREAEAEEAGLWAECDSQASQADPELEQASDPYSKECVIKGNINKRYGKDYFLPGCPNYKRVKIDPRKGELWFCTEEEAVASGWQRSAACNNIWQMMQ